MTYIDMKTVEEVYPEKGCCKKDCSKQCEKQCSKQCDKQACTKKTCPQDQCCISKEQRTAIYNMMQYSAWHISLADEPLMDEVLALVKNYVSVMR